MAKQDYMASIDDAKTQETQKQAESSGGFREWKSGKNVLYLLPPVVNTGFATGKILTAEFRYWRLPPSGNAMAVDIFNTFGPGYDDPIHDAIDALQAQEVNTKSIEDKSNPRFFGNVIDLASDDLRVQVQRFPKGLAQWILEQISDDDLAGKGVLNPYSCTPLVVQYSPDEKDQRKVYQPSWALGRANRPVAESDEAIEALMAQASDMAEIIKMPEGEDMEAIVEIAKELFEHAAPVEQPVNAAAGNEADRDDLPF